MKRIEEKVKDIVEVRPFESLRDFTSDPAKTLAGYHFTEATSDLMARWIDRIAAVQGRNGAAFALAGYRGVGKSHFLASLGAVVAQPELRTRISDTHVAASAQRLLRKHYPVVHVRRGTFATLLEELQHAIGETLSVERSSVPETAREIFDLVAGKYGDLPFILIIDTALERGERVTRDDGGFLAELAHEVGDRNVFLGVALDDDIAGADGANSAIARTFSIDYLDQEHLYKVVNAHVFPKHRQMQSVLRDIYAYFRDVVPDFRWSEQRFSSLYPLHPAILEIAPFVRLYVHEFALLSFAAGAGERILGRPANSLIALDEVFDNAESDLRKVADLSEAFTAYDRLNAEVVAKIPVMQRLQAKLVLKALLILSLDGQGATAADICAGMLIFDEDEPGRAARNVGELIQKFADALPELVQVEAAGSDAKRYRLKVRSKENLNRALAEAVGALDPSVIDSVLARLMADRFDDAGFFDAESLRREWIDCQIVWRGGLRRGRVVWPTEAGSEPPRTASGPDFVDWELFIDRSGTLDAAGTTDDAALVLWKPDPLRADEIETILRFNALGTDAGLRDEFGDQIRASLHSHNLSVDRIFARSFLDDGKISIEGFDYNFTDEAKSKETLSDALSVMLEPLFETRFPEHPFFAQRLGVNEVSMLVTDLYSGNRQYLDEVQRLAETFALPLGLVRDQGGAFVPQTEETLLQLPLARMILDIVAEAGKEPAGLKTIYGELRKAPFGLAREAQQLILAALVAQRQIEFVTSKGDRINRRSLDLQILWDDIVAVARPADSSYSAKKLIRWGILFAGASGFRSLDDLADREILRSAFLKWIAEWKRVRVLERFNELPDDVLNTRIWNQASRASKTLGSVAENITACLDGSISYEECLARVADAFLDVPEEMEATQEQLGIVGQFVKGAAQREQVESYLALCDGAGSDELETLRNNLLSQIDRSYYEPGDAANRELGYLWTKFHREYTELFAAEHDVTMKSHGLQEKFDEIMRSERMWLYRSLPVRELVQTGEPAAIEQMLSRFSELDCRTNVREALKTRPFCTCSFTLANAAEWHILTEMITGALDAALEAFGGEVARMAESTTDEIQTIIKYENDKELSEVGESLSARLKGGFVLDKIDPLEIQLLRRALRLPDGAVMNGVSPSFQPNGARAIQRETIDEKDVVNV